MTVTFEVDRLVLDGYPRHHRHAIARAFGREVERLLRERDVPEELHARRGDGLRIDRPPRAGRPEDVGRELARRVYDGLGGVA